MKRSMNRPLIGLALSSALSCVVTRAFGAEPTTTARPQNAAVDAESPPISAEAPASNDAPRVQTDPSIHRAPISEAPGHTVLQVQARVSYPERIKLARLVYRVRGKWFEVPFERSVEPSSPYLAVIAAENVVGELAYAIEVELQDGIRRSVFASRQIPHPVLIRESFMDAREAALLERVGGRRSVVTLSADTVDFGAVDAKVHDSSAPSGTAIKTFRDGYQKAEASYTYRSFQTVAEFGIRVGAVRGHSVVPNELDPNKFNVGLNYGSPRVRLRAADFVHFDVEGLMSVTEIGFSLGGGGALLIGDPLDTHMTFGGEVIDVFGARGYVRFDLQASRKLVLAPTIEITNMPHAATGGMRLLGEATYQLGSGFGVGVRGGYQARKFSDGGASLGATASYAF